MALYKLRYVSKPRSVSSINRSVDMETEFRARSDEFAKRKADAFLRGEHELANVRFVELLLVVAKAKPDQRSGCLEAQSTRKPRIPSRLRKGAVGFGKLTRMVDGQTDYGFMPWHR